mmetsp:Transcript_13183/g.20690  ORF Transcript_13183/g.20690 Transcript_13183/m.20690 type:complete len:210 (+) Transcript_13183:286-915(+)
MGSIVRPMMGAFTTRGAQRDFCFSSAALLLILFLNVAVGSSGFAVSPLSESVSLFKQHRCCGLIPLKRDRNKWKGSTCFRLKVEESQVLASQGQRQAAEPQVGWSLKRFEELTIRELYEAMILRQEVFVVEQNCVYLDADGADPSALHFFGWDGEGERRKLIAYLRVKVPSSDHVRTNHDCNVTWALALAHTALCLGNDHCARVHSLCG